MKPFAIALVIGLLAISPASAQEKFIWAGNPAKSNLTDYFEEIGKKVAADSGGQLELDVRYGLALANFNNMIDRVGSDVVQMGITFLGIYGDRFALSETTGLPFVMDDPVAG